MSKQVTVNRTTTTTLYAYDQAGHLIGEYGPNGAMEKEYIWLNNRPLALVTPKGVYSILTDQRGAPRLVTNASAAVIWQWNPSPFGEGAPVSTGGGLTVTTPSGKTVPLTHIPAAHTPTLPGNAGLPISVNGFVFNLRYPGQYYDAQTGLYYNNARYYDPAIGRYLASDPIGLAGGIDTYAYVGSNPLNLVDPMGLSGEGVHYLVPFVPSVPEVGGEEPAQEEEGEELQQLELDTDRAAVTVFSDTFSNSASCSASEVSKKGTFPDEVFKSKAPNQVTPGTRKLEGQHINDQGRVEPWKAEYDEYGRLKARTDYNAGNKAQDIPSTHHHTYEWGPGKTPMETGSHLPGEYKP